ncbi:MAG: ATP-binding protein, partial [Gammaproteobacteria bacterium]|nr:ATP-binding protein [Gammaproteobacteria bacterium]
MNQPFRVSTGLKDLIGQGLITNDYVAVFELVKNSFDAHARSVRIVFLPDKIIIADDGKGMSRDDVTGKWLFVAYSAKRDGTEDLDYRHDIGQRRRHAYAGAKGVGRFSCDRLGQKLTLYSRAKGHGVQKLKVDWRLYEEDAKSEFGRVGVSLEERQEFPNSIAKYAGSTGTILKIQCLRSNWDRSNLLGLRRELAKLINPFQSDSDNFQIIIDAPSEALRDKAKKRIATVAR